MRVGFLPAPARLVSYAPQQAQGLSSRSLHGTSRVITTKRGLWQRRGACRAGLVAARFFSDPYKTLGVSADADEREIKRAHRKLVKLHHPDVRQDDPAAEARFLAIQEAYEVIMGRRRGKEADASADGNSWSFHDWYWRFSMSKRWGQGRKSARAGPSPFASATPAPEGQWKSQLDGLKRKAAAKRGQRRRQAGPAWSPPAAGGPGGQPTASGQGSGAGAERQAGPQEQEAQPGRRGPSQHAGEPQSPASTPGDATLGQQEAQRAGGRGAPEAAEAQQGPAAQHGARLEAEAAAHQTGGGVAFGAERGAGAAAPELDAQHAAARGLGSMQPMHSAGAERSHVPQHEEPQDAGAALAGAVGSAARQAAQAQDAEQQLRQELVVERLLSQMVGTVQRLGEQSGSVVRNHIVALGRHTSRLGRHVQVQLARLQELSAARRAHVSAQHAQHTMAELHVEFEEAVRQRHWAPDARGSSPGASHVAGTWPEAAGAAWDSHQMHEGGAAGGGGRSSADTAAHQQRSVGEEGRAQAQPPCHGPAQEPNKQRRRFVNDGQVRERVSSQLVGLRRRTAIRQELGEE